MVEDERKRGGGKETTREIIYDDKKCKMVLHGVAMKTFMLIKMILTNKDNDIFFVDDGKGPDQMKTGDEEERCGTR